MISKLTVCLLAFLSWSRCILIIVLKSFSTLLQVRIVFFSTLSLSKLWAPLYCAECTYCNSDSKLRVYSADFGKGLDHYTSTIFLYPAHLSPYSSSTNNATLYHKFLMSLWPLTQCCLKNLQNNYSCSSS
jgi:hypothetical protein